MSNIVNALNKILDKGTKIVSFDYDGQLRNILVGANTAVKGDPVWGVQVNRAIRTHKGNFYLVGIDNNDNHCFKAFNVKGIQNPSFC